MSNEPLLTTSKKSTAGIMMQLLAQRLRGHTPYSLLRKLAQQPTLRATAAFAVSGLAFAVGTLLLARSMPVTAFGNLALAIALFNVFGLLAPLGIDQVLLRHRIEPDRRLLLRLLASGSAIGILVGLGYMLASDLTLADSLALGLAIAAGGLIATLTAIARAAMREAPALILVTAASWILLAIGVLSLIFPMTNALWPLSMFALGNLAVALWGWWQLKSIANIADHPSVQIPWNEAYSLLGIAAIGTIVLQLERLIIPPLIGISALALFSVLASVAIFPFRLLTASAGFSMVPKLRATDDTRQRRKLVRIEFFSVLSLLLAATVGVVAIGPLLTEWLTGGRYQISAGLALAACLNGSAKVFQALPRAVLTGCGGEKDIALLNRLGMLGLVTSSIGAMLGSQWQLTGLLYGVALGSAVGSVPAMVLARRSLK